MLWAQTETGSACKCQVAMHRRAHGGSLASSELLSKAPCLPFLLPALCPAMDDAGLLAPEPPWVPPGIVIVPCPSCNGMSRPISCPEEIPRPKSEAPSLSLLPAEPLRRLVLLKPNMTSPGIWEPAWTHAMLS